MNDTKDQIYQLEVPDAPESNRDITQGVALTIAGVSFAGVGLFGIDAIEAKNPQEALMSSSLEFVGIKEHFVTTSDIPFAMMALAGIFIAKKGINKLRRQN